jgi:hypothetical protein
LDTERRHRRTPDTANRIRGWRLAAVCVGLAVAAASAAAQRPQRPTFTLGSSAADVRLAQGVPDLIERYTSLGVEIWSYGRTTVRLSADSGRVIGWDNRAGALRVATPAARRAGGEPWGRSGSAGAHGANTHAPSSTPSAPATLDATVALREPSGNGALDGGERGTIEVAIRNRGPGQAREVHVRVAADSGAGEISVGSVAPIATLEAGSIATVLVPVVASDMIGDGTARLRIEAREASGFDLAPARRLTVATRRAQAPAIAVVGMRSDDQSGDGRIAPRELADVTVRLRNAGPGDARDVHVAIAAAPDVFLARESPTAVDAGTMRPGETRDVTVAAYTNSRARTLALTLTITEATGRHGTTVPIALPLDRPLASTIDVQATPARVADSSAAPPFVDEVDADPPLGAPNADAVAVVLGVERYRALPAARFAARDATLFARYATRTLGVPDDRAHVYLRTDAEVTGNEFRKLFADDGWLARRVRPTTDLYVYYAGHGAADAKTHTPYLLPADADGDYARDTGYSLAALYEQLAKLPARTVTVFLDACFSGVTRSNDRLVAGGRDIVLSVEHPALRKESMAVFAAAHGDQIASDLPAKRHGLFTYYLLAGLRGAGDADGDGRVTIRELDGWIAPRVRQTAGTLDREQDPLTIAVGLDRPVATVRP